MTVPTNTTTFAALADSHAREIIAASYALLLADRNAIINHPALRYAGRINGTGTATLRLPLIGLGGKDLPAAVDDGDEVALTTLEDDKIEVTVSRFSKAYSLTDLARLADAAGLDLQAFASDAFQSAMLRLTDLVVTAGSGFTPSVGSSGVDLDVETFLQAKTTLELANVEGPYLAGLHTQQFADLREELATTSGGATQWMPASAEIVDRIGRGYAGRFAGVDIWVSNRWPTANAGADRVGCMMGRDAIVWADGTPVVDDPATQFALEHGLFELDRKARYGSTELVTHTYLGVSRGQSAAGVKIVSDA
jgi:hypothetical protein